MPGRLLDLGRRIDGLACGVAGFVHIGQHGLDDSLDRRRNAGRRIVLAIKARLFNGRYDVRGAGKAAVDRLMTEHGPLMSIPTLLALLSADCPKRQAAKMHDVCGAHMPQLPGIFMSKP